MAVYDRVAEAQPSVHRLENGITVALEHLPHLHSATAGVWIGAGSVHELEPQAGISHFLEHLFFKGTTTRSARQLMDAIESKGGHMNAFTSREHTCLYVKCLDRHLSSGLEILADVLQHSTFHDFEKERNVILEEIVAGMDVPEELAHDRLTLRAWPDQPIGRPIAGSVESVSSITIDDVITYKSAWYQPDNLTIAVVGNFDEAAVLREIEDRFGGIVRGPLPSSDWAAQFMPGTDVIERDIAQNHLGFAFPAPAVTDLGLYQHEMVNSVLGGGSTSRLFDRIREEEGLAYSIYSFHAGYLKASMMGVYAAVAPENFDLTLRLASEELRKLQDDPVSPDELSSNAEQLKGGLLLALEGTFNRMTRMARSLLYFGRVQPVEEILDAVDEVTAADMQRIAQQVFSADRCAIAVLGPPPPNGAVLALP